MYYVYCIGCHGAILKSTQNPRRGEHNDLCVRQEKGQPRISQYGGAHPTDKFVRISPDFLKLCKHIGAANQRKWLCSNNFPSIRGEPRSTGSVPRSCLSLKLSGGDLW